MHDRINRLLRDIEVLMNEVTPEIEAVQVHLAGNLRYYSSPGWYREFNRNLAAGDVQSAQRDLHALFRRTG